MLVETKARIGIMALALDAYLHQVDGLRENFEQQFARSKRCYFQGNYELYDAGIVSVREDAERAGALFRTNDVDLVFVQTMTYALSNKLAPAIEALDVPVIILNLQRAKAPDYRGMTDLSVWISDCFACGSVPEMASTLQRMGKRCDVITGYLEEDATVREQVARWTAAAAVRARFRKTNAIFVGKQYTGMLDLCTSETNLYNRLRIYYDSVDWEVLWRIADNVDRGGTAVGAKAQEIADTFEIKEGGSPDELLDLAAYAVGFENLVKERNISMLASMYDGFAEGKAGELNAMMNPICSMLIKQGTACAVEGDIKAAITMSILKTLSGAGTLGELFALDFNDDVALLGHSGSGDPEISAKKPLMKKVDMFPGKIGGGYVTQFYPGAGGTTLLSLSENEEGGYSLVAAEGVVEDGDVMELGDTNQRTRFSIGIREFVNEWAKAAPTHHFAMTGGRHIEAIKCVAQILNLPLQIVCR
jgi:L-arabinose isomerase